METFSHFQFSKWQQLLAGNEFRILQLPRFVVVETRIVNKRK